MNKLEIKDFLLEITLLSGQFFNFKLNDDGFYILSNGNNVFKIKQEKNTLLYEGISKEDLKNLFDLNFDLNILSKFDDNHFQIAFEKYRGLRSMNCDLFQTIISFVCSAAANQKKIENNIKLISEKFGIYNKEYNFYSFPNPEDIANDVNVFEKLNECKVGYRAKYILSISNYLRENPNFLKELKKENYSHAHSHLTTLEGVGSKVADCICLFALNHMQAFPVDTWIKKMLNQWYNFEGNQRKLEQFAKIKFGDLGGYYQQYLFHLLRDEKELK